MPKHAGVIARLLSVQVVTSYAWVMDIVFIRRITVVRARGRARMWGARLGIICLTQGVSRLGAGVVRAGRRPILFSYSFTSSLRIS